jgi:hypothetical protein
VLGFGESHCVMLALLLESFDLLVGPAHRGLGLCLALADCRDAGRRAGSDWTGHDPVDREQQQERQDRSEQAPAVHDGGVGSERSDHVVDAGAEGWG